MKTLYLHIGTPKTATSSLQLFCERNVEVLKNKGYCYPIFPFKYTNKESRRNALFLTAIDYDDDGNRDTDIEDVRRKTGYDSIRKIFKSCDNVILSDESIWSACYKRRKDIWEELVSAGADMGFQLKVIVYLRRQDEFVDSWWNQLVKGGTLTRTWDEFLLNIPKYFQLDYFQALERISKVIGRENLIARRFDKAFFYDGAIERDFFHILGLKIDDDFEPPEKAANLRLGGNTHEFKRLINEFPELSMDQRRYFRSVLWDCSPLSKDDYPCSMFSASEARDFVSKYDDSNQKLAEKYFGDEYPAFSDVYEETQKWKKDNPYIHDDTVRFIAQSNMHLLKKIELERERIDALRKEVKQERALIDKLKYQLKHPFSTAFDMIGRRFGDSSGAP